MLWVTVKGAPSHFVIHSCTWMIWKVPWFGSQGELLLCSRLNVCLYGSSHPAGLYMWPRQERRPPRFPMNTFLLERFATATPTTEGNSEERGGSRFQCKENHFRYQDYSKKGAIWIKLIRIVASCSFNVLSYTVCLQVSWSLSEDTFSSWEHSGNRSMSINQGIQIIQENVMIIKKYLVYKM